MLRSLALASALTFAAGLAQAQSMSPLDYPQPAEGTDFLTVVEIPQGSFTKYELNTEIGYVVVDRFQSMPVIYPANYGSIPSSLGGDGDPLDALIYTREPIVPGAVILGRPIGILHMIDGGEEDAKIVAVPASDIDPTYDDIQDISDLPAIERQRLEQFFAVYKTLPEGRKKVELSGFGNAEEAKAMIKTAFDAYKAKH
ncbi:inorganic diphosphatase [Frigidibacter sp. MR17.14]|uniref:inorganic diphosphatase n=1 Tax=Frigidibacter sp. MR17.14 TaxID=3126509 RepID=UPI003012C03B